MSAVDGQPAEPPGARAPRVPPGQSDLTAATVLVTGGTRGIGAGIARGFLRAGARVLVCGRTEPAELPCAGGRTALFTRADIRDPEQAAGTVRTSIDLFHRLDVVVSNAGGSPSAGAATASPRFHAKVIELNLIAPLHIAQAANAVMQEQGSGSIIMVGSVSGSRPSPGTAAYGAAKAGLQHLVTSLAIEWGPAVRINCVVPGFVATESVAEQYGDPAAVAAVAATVPLAPAGDPGRRGAGLPLPRLLGRRLRQRDVPDRARRR